MTRVRVEGLLSAFPKLVSAGKQHTYVETENVRYVYQPLECGTLYLLLVTTKGSNILEDLDVLRLLAKTLPEYTQGQVDEEGVSYAAFDLIFAFDEIISLGYKENVTMAQVKTFTEMQSHEEKLHKMMIQSKINDTKDVMRRKATEIDKVKLESKIQQQAMHARGGAYSALNQGFGSRTAGGFGGSPSGGFGGGFGGGNQPFGGPAGFEDGRDDEFGYLGRSGSEGGGFDGERPSGGFRSKYSEDLGGYGQSGKGSGMPQKSLAGPKKGMQLGGKPKTNQFLESLRAEGESVEPDFEPMRSSVPEPAPAPAMPTESVSLVIEEKLNVSLNRNGGLEQMELQGNMLLEVRNEDDALIRVMTKAGANSGFQFKTHPNIDKGLHANEGVLGLKDPNRPFPCGSALGVLKWRFTTKDESQLPISINCWPTINGGETAVSIEYEATDAMDLQHVVISVPCPPCRDPPVVNSCDGEFRFDARHGVMEWNIELIDSSNRSGSMEFIIPVANTEAFFPIDVNFSSTQTFCDIDITSIARTTDGAPVTFACKKMMLSDSYQVV
ncbi:Coatomer delta subunit [Ostreococcus tauri]|uniref:Coatomer subunit delta n=1 Tax=Ostreococcus tauri TaxID=70448 RepID=A0A090LZI1_OSTTA|nr:Coatomer delta subunit [Ostreococcus tauri]CEF97336.1 Coatomer delta subunit [Ostreococcus tauri]|eukprot:XP_022838638.1 Coatomer delta subunit [Ostreococcus tauri]